MAIVSLDAFVQQLGDSRLLSPAQLEEITKDLITRFPEPKELARHLLKTGWLTPYQVNQLFQGRGHQLVLGRYVLLERLGEGGMGQVFKARHQSMNRIVALKVIRKECLANPDAVRRFQREIQAAGQLTHQNIVIAHDADHVGDTHFFAMEYVEGTDLSRLVREKGPLPITDACDYVRQAALGLQHASERGLVHRDIKPGNLLLTKKGNTIKVLDMGLARLQQPGEEIGPALSLTVEGSVMGTPDFIAPEQAHESHTVDIRADIYSLGCTLYFLLTGQVPYPGGTLMQKLMKHQNSAPPSAELFRPEIPSALRDVLRKLMAKNPDDRYQTPQEVAVALEAFSRAPMSVPIAVPVAVAALATVAMAPPELESEPHEGQAVTLPVGSALIATHTDANLSPTKLTPPSLGARFLGVAKKRKWIVAGAGGAAALLIGVVVLLLFRNPRTEPIVEEKPTKPPPLVELVKVLGGDSARQWGPITSIAVSPDGKIVATGGEDNAIRLWDAKTLQQYREPLIGHAGPVRCLAFSPNSKQLASGGNDRTVLVWDLEGKAREPGRIAPGGNDVYGVAFSRDGKLILTCGFKQSIQLWDVKSGGGAVHACTTTADIVSKAAFWPDDDHVLYAGDAGKVGLYSIKEKKQIKSFKGHTGNGRWLALVDNKSFIVAADDGTARMWNRDSEEEVAAFGDKLIGAMAYDAKHRRLLAVGPDKELRLWDVGKLQSPPRVFADHPTKPGQIALSPDGTTAFTGGPDLVVRQWDVDTGKETGSPVGHQARVVTVALSPDGGQALSAAADGEVYQWDVAHATAQRCSGFSGDPLVALISPDGERQLAIARNGNAFQWDLGNERVRLNIPWSAQTAPAGALFAPDSHHVLFLGSTTNNYYSDLKSSAFVTFSGAPLGRTICASFLQDGKTFVGGGLDCFLRRWDVTGKEVDSFPGHKGPVQAVVCMPDGRTVLSVSNEQDKRLLEWDLKASDTYKRAVKLEWDIQQVSSSNFSPNGALLAITGFDGQIILWETKTGKKLTYWKLPGPVRSLAFSRDSNRLATANDNGTVNVYQLNLPGDAAKSP
jgi:WD40 repeat protein/serine/threonine protein kinase